MTCHRQESARPWFSIWTLFPREWPLALGDGPRSRHRPKAYWIWNHPCLRAKSAHPHLMNCFFTEHVNVDSPWLSIKCVFDCVCICRWNVCISISVSYSLGAGQFDELVVSMYKHYSLDSLIFPSRSLTCVCPHVIGQPLHKRRHGLRPRPWRRGCENWAGDVRSAGGQGSSWWHVLFLIGTTRIVHSEDALHR